MVVNPEQRITERFDEIEAALFDLKPGEFGIFQSQQFVLCLVITLVCVFLSRDF